MRATRSSKTPRRRRLALVLALLGSLIAAVGGLVVSTASAASPAPVTIVIDGVTSDVQAPTGTPGAAVPYVLVQAGGTIHVRVSFYDVYGAPASFQKDTPLVITSDQGGPTPATVTAPRGMTSVTLDTSLPVAANQVSLTVSVPGKAGRTVTPGTSTADQRFDVVNELRFVDSAPNSSFEQGIGGDDSNCQYATPADPVCGTLILPHGAQSSQVLLSLGVCDTTYAGCGSTSGAVVQALAQLDGLYTDTDPAALLIKCDKTLCAGGAIQDQHLSFSLNGNDALATAEACPAKATLGAGQDACVDYVQSKRDGSGDTLLYLLFTQDMRGSVG
ncbi:hypothetical protein [Nocardioides mesophilus]|uniref:Uncharacterized protein n=1 Tax=Nocardioides mesophilus TaxID=433659 RepID=A0A7G9RAP5_9ACTN|nr:hypothetical protein [Nocardioides mesophilus]QNN52670.1 hypothetical protein H9L09_19865 [Nocardioides mesophilus]